MAHYAGGETAAAVRHFDQEPAVREPLLPMLPQPAGAGIETIAISRERVVKEFALMGLSNMEDFIERDANGAIAGIDVSQVSRDQMAAIKSIEVHTCMDGRGDDAREVKRVKVTLYEKIPALITLAKLMGWLVEGEETLRIEERLRKMTPEQRRADAVRSLRALAPCWRGLPMRKIKLCR